MIGTCLYCKKEFKKREYKRKFCSLICSSNFNKNGLRRITLPKETVELAEFIGICLGDGCVSKYQVADTLNATADRYYITYVKNLAKKLFPEASISLVFRDEQNTMDIKVNSSIASKFLYNMGIVAHNKIVPSWIYKSKACKFACVRGLIDTEGSISIKRYRSKKGLREYRQLNFRNTNVILMRFVRDVLVELGLHPTMTLKKSLYLSNPRSIQVYKRYINFSNQKLINKAINTNEVKWGYDIKPIIFFVNMQDIHYFHPSCQEEEI